MHSSSTLIQNAELTAEERCPICGTPLVRAVEPVICTHCEPEAREEIEIINAHFRVPAGELARVNPSFIRRMA